MFGKTFLFFLKITWTKRVALVINGSRQKGSAMVRLSNQRAPPEVILSTGQLAIPGRIYCLMKILFLLAFLPLKPKKKDMKTGNWRNIGRAFLIGLIPFFEVNIWSSWVS